MLFRYLKRRHLAEWVAAPLLVLVLMGLTSSAYAQASSSIVMLRERNLSFHGRLGDALDRTFTLTVAGLPISNVRFVRHDLIDTTTGVAILSSDITLDPETVAQVADQQSVGVTVAKATRAGHYSGMLEVRYDNQPTTAPLTLTLDVRFDAVPNVDADVNSKNLTLYVQELWCDFPYFGQPAAVPNGPPQSEVTLNLIQSAESEAEVREANVLTLRDSQGRTLPKDTVRVMMTKPITISANGIAPLQVVVSGENLAAGEYNGTLRVSVRDQSAPIQLPVTVRVKHGWLLPLLVLAAGLATAYLFSYWNSSGKATHNLAEQIRTLFKNIQKRDRLQANDRDQAIVLLQEAFAGINEGKPPAQIQERFDAAQKIVGDARTAADALLNGPLAEAISITKSIDAGQLVRENLLQKLNQIDSRVRKGSFRQRSEAIDQVATLRRQIDEYKNIVNFLDGVDPAKQRDVRIKLDQQTTIYALYDTLRVALDGTGKPVPPPPHTPGSFGADLQPRDAVASSDKFELTRIRRFQLLGTRAIVGIVAYVFALLVGFVSIYAVSPTFGAQPMEYISLYLWGAVIETVRGQTITFSSLQTLFKEKVQPPAPPSA